MDNKIVHFIITLARNFQRPMSKMIFNMVFIIISEDKIKKQ